MCYSHFPCHGHSSSSFLACNFYDCVVPYVDIILHKERFGAKSASSGSVRWCCFRSCWTVLSHSHYHYLSEHARRPCSICSVYINGRCASMTAVASQRSSEKIVICPDRTDCMQLICPSMSYSMQCIV